MLAASPPEVRKVSDLPRTAPARQPGLRPKSGGATPKRLVDSDGKAKPYRTLGSPAANADGSLVRRRLFAFLFSRRINQRRAGHHVAFVGLNQTHALGAAAGLANVVGLEANQLGLLGNNHYL